MAASKRVRLRAGQDWDDAPRTVADVSGGPLAAAASQRTQRADSLGSVTLGGGLYVWNPFTSFKIIFPGLFIFCIV